MKAGQVWFVALIDKGSILVTLLLSFLLLREPITPRCFAERPHYCGVARAHGAPLNLPFLNCSHG